MILFLRNNIAMKLPQNIKLTIGFNLFFNFFIFLIIISAPYYLYAQTKEVDNVEAKTQIVSHFVHHGLSESNKDPSLQTEISVPLGPQFKAAIWGGNVSYEGLDEHFWLKFMFDLKVDISKDVALLIGYNLNQFYKSKQRNGNTQSIRLEIYSYQIKYERESNWEGYEESSKYVSFGKSFSLQNNITWDNQVGYIMLNVESLQNYFDIRSQINYKHNRLNYLAAITATSNPGQFSGRGDVFGLIGIGINY